MVENFEESLVEVVLENEEYFECPETSQLMAGISDIAMSRFGQRTTSA